MQRAALLLACCACLGAQPAAVEGVAVNQANGQPLAGVHIRLFRAASDDDKQPYGAISDRAGHFSIASLPAGTYLAQATARGFFYMPPKTGIPVPRVSVKAGQHLTDFKVEMAQEAVISGRVLDENGDPVQTGLHADPESERAGYFGRWGNSDERGEFHLRVAPGKYYLVAEAGGRNMSQVPEIRTDGTVDATYGRTYFPGSAAKSKAVLVEATAGAELAGMDIHLAHQARGGNISGTVTGVTEPIGRIMVWLSVRQGDNPGHGNTAGATGAGTDGRFQFVNLEPDTYWVLGRYQNGKTRLYSQPVEVRLEGNDVTGVNLVLGPGGEFTGKLEMSGGQSTEKLTVSLVPVSTNFSGDSAPSAEVDASGSFRLSDIAPERYRVNVTPMPENGYLKSVRLDGVEEADGVLELSRGALGSSLKIVVSRNGGQVTGKLLDKDGQPLGAVPAMVLLAADLKEIDFERSLKVAEDGTYGFQGIRPGKYRLLAFDQDQLAGGSEFLEAVKTLAAAAEEIEIKEGDRKVKDLKLTVKEDADAKPHK